VAALITPTRVHIVHIGDSRAYVIRGGVAQPLTRDHSFVQGLVDRGEITAEEALHHPRRNWITKAITGAAVEPTWFSLSPELGDTYLLCSDGVWEPASTAIASVAGAGGPDLAGRVADLCETALRSGSRDNVTALAGAISAE
jgi:serine/threonine protein phosphatase PrpC